MKDGYNLYIDVVFILNFLMNIPSLILSVIIEGKYIKTGRIITAAACGSIIYCIYLSCTYNAGFFNRLVALILTEPVMIYILHGSLKIKVFMTYSFILILSGCILGGAIINTQNIFSGINDVLAFFVSSVLTVLAVKRVFAVKRHQNNLYDVEISCCGKHFRGKGFGDTGNLLYDPVYGIPVTIMKRNEWTESMLLSCENRRVVIFHKGIGKEKGMLPGIRLDSMTISGKDYSYMTEKAIIAVSEGISDKADYQFIIHSDMI